jgi:hypothetical protein
MMKFTTAFLFLPLAAASNTVSDSCAQPLQELEKREAALIEAWTAAPLTVRRVVFVSERPAGFGQYKERPNSTFKAGEKLVTYAEPVGYGWKDIGNGVFLFGFKADFQIKSRDGEVLAVQENFADLVQNSRARNREFLVTLTLTLNGAPAGDYAVEYKLRDIASPKTVVFSQPFTIKD